MGSDPCHRYSKQVDITMGGGQTPFVGQSRLRGQLVRAYFDTSINRHPVLSIASSGVSSFSLFAVKQDTTSLTSIEFKARKKAKPNSCLASLSRDHYGSTHRRARGLTQANCRTRTSVARNPAETNGPGQPPVKTPSRMVMKTVATQPAVR